jgi:hypothetical protein
MSTIDRISGHMPGGTMTAQPGKAPAKPAASAQLPVPIQPTNELGRLVRALPDGLAGDLVARGVRAVTEKANAG